MTKFQPSVCNIDSLKDFEDALSQSFCNRALKISLMHMPTKRQRVASKLRSRLMNDRTVWSCDGKNWFDTAKEAVDHAARNMNLWESWQ